MKNRAFKTIWIALEPAEKLALAKSLYTSVNVLSQIAHGHREPSLRYRELIFERLGERCHFTARRLREPA